MGRQNFAAEMMARAEACLRAIHAAAANPMVDGAYSDRGNVMATIQFIKAKAREAEILMSAQRSGLDRWPLLDRPPYAGIAQEERRGSLPGGRGIEPAPRSTLTDAS